MAAGFWLSSRSTPITVEEIQRLDEDGSRLFLAELRWGHKDKQVCNSCGALDSHYVIRRRRQWRCKHCFHTFSVTSGTPFADRKMSYRRLVHALMEFVVSQKGVPALQLKRIIGGQYRTSFRLLHKLREALMVTMLQEKLSGTVEIDGAHLSGRPRKGRKKKKKSDPAIPNKWNEQHRSKVGSRGFSWHPNRRIVMAIREHFGLRGRGASRTVVEICKTENSHDAEAIARKWIASGSTIMSDEWGAYGKYKLMGYTHLVVNHQVEFSTDDGVNENQAESFFSRMRRAVIGVYHRVTPRYMLDYMIELAWREDVRRENVKKQLTSLMDRVFTAGLSKDWRGYGHGNKRSAELLFKAESVAS